MQACVVELANVQIEQLWQGSARKPTLSVKLGTGGDTALKGQCRDNVAGHHSVAAFGKQTIEQLTKLPVLPDAKCNREVQVLEVCKYAKRPLRQLASLGKY